MAGIKITDLTPLATAASDDLFYIVDVSDTTESPQGTSKQIAVGNLLPVVESGEFSPTFSSFTGAIIALTTTRNYFQKIGDIVTASLNLEIEVDFSLVDSGDVIFTYPIATTTADGGGLLSSNNISKQFNGAIKQNKIFLLSTDTTLVGTFNFQAIFQYEIV